MHFHSFCKKKPSVRSTYRSLRMLCIHVGKDVPGIARDGSFRPLLSFSLHYPSQPASTSLTPNVSYKITSLRSLYTLLLQSKYQPHNFVARAQPLRYPRPDQVLETDIARRIITKLYTRTLDS